MEFNEKAKDGDYLTIILRNSAEYRAEYQAIFRKIERISQDYLLCADDIN